jgi:hypothetical protein
MLLDHFWLSLWSLSDCWSNLMLLPHGATLPQQGIHLLPVSLIVLFFMLDFHQIFNWGYILEYNAYLGLPVHLMIWISWVQALLCQVLGDRDLTHFAILFPPVSYSFLVRLTMNWVAVSQVQKLACLAEPTYYTWWSSSLILGILPLLASCWRDLPAPSASFSVDRIWFVRSDHVGSLLELLFL